MSTYELIAAFTLLLSSWGALWYKIGRLAHEVREHNLKLDNIQKQLERFIIGKGG